MIERDPESSVINISQCLIQAGYSPVPRPLYIGTVNFGDSIDAFTSGPAFLDIVIVIELPDGSEDMGGAQWLIRRVARALDITGSRRPLTAILVTAKTPSAKAMDDILRVARVLVVNGLSTVDAQLAPLLPLTIASPSDPGHDALEQVAETIKGGDSAQLRQLVRAAQSSSADVEKRLRGWLDASFTTDGTTE